MVLNRLSFLSALLLLFLSLPNAHAGLKDMIASATGTATPATVHILMIDDTNSMEATDKKLYSQVVNAAMAVFKAGDRVLIVRISDIGLGQFRTNADITVKRTGVHFDDLDALKKAQKEVGDTAATIISSSEARKSTRIFDALSGLDSILKTARAQKMKIRVVVLTDGIEEHEVNFKKVVDRDFISYSQQATKQRLSKNLIPDLQGAEMYWVGIGAETSARTKALENFWVEYCTGAKATIAHIGRSIPAFK